MEQSSRPQTAKYVRKHQYFARKHTTFSRPFANSFMCFVSFPFNFLLPLLLHYSCDGTHANSWFKFIILFLPCRTYLLLFLQKQQMTTKNTILFCLLACASGERALVTGQRQDSEATANLAAATSTMALALLPWHKITQHQRIASDLHMQFI